MKLRRKPGKPGYWTNRSKKLGRLERVFNENGVFIFLKAELNVRDSVIAEAVVLGLATWVARSTPAIAAALPA
jgi:hypothetical protein